MTQLRRILDTLPEFATRLRAKAALFAARERTRRPSEADAADAVVLNTREAYGVALDLEAIAEGLDALARVGPGDQDQVA